MNMRDLRIVFMGTSSFAETILQAMLAAQWGVIVVVTQPDRPNGRKRTITPSPVKQLAIQHGLPVLQPERLRTPEAQASLAQWQPDVIVTAAYGQILPVAVLQLPRQGAFNVHGSLLPLYRGGAPIQWAIRDGATKSGVSLMTMSKSMDAGAVWSQREVAIAPHMTYGELHDELALIGAALVLDALPRILAGELQATEQDPAQVTYAPTISHADEQIDWTQSTAQVINQIRSLCPRPGAFTRVGDQTLKIWSAARATDETVCEAAPGTIVEMTSSGPLIACGDGLMLATRLQLAGKTEQAGGDFARSRHAWIGTVLAAKEAVQR